MMTKMKSTIAGIAAAAMLATTMLAAVPAAAQPGFYGDQAMHQRNDDWRLRHHRGWGNRGWGHRGWDDGSSAVGAGILGFMTGAFVAQAFSQPGWQGSCAQRFRTYNPATGSYTGYDGHQHACP